MKKEKIKINYKDIIKKIEPELEKQVENFQQEVNSLKGTRASPSLVENIPVDCFGNRFFLKQLSHISVEGSREILIQPWDESYIQPIVSALNEKGLGTVVYEKNLIRIKLGSVSEDFKKEVLRALSEKKEQTKQLVRRLRQKVWDELQEREKRGEISEDEKYKGKKELQQLIDKIQERIEEISKKKEADILG
jgi:ribosome recycling factor